MSNPNLDIKFNYSSINAYYTRKLAKVTGFKPKLLTRKVTSLEDFVQHLDVVKKELSVDLPASFHWSTLINKREEDAPRIWVFREYIFCSTMLLVDTILTKKSSWLSIINRYIPDTIDTSENTFTVIGSQLFSSDIDVTIQGNHTTLIISIIEDIFELLTKDYSIPVSHMDIQFYADFRILRNLYVNVSLFSASQRIRMLNYAFISYFRALHIVDKPYSVSPLAKRLGFSYLKKLNVSHSLKSVLDDAFEEWKLAAPKGVLNRESFYEQSSKIEFESDLLEQHMHEAGTSFISILADELFFSMARAHIQRAESYILSSTAIHIVEIEQVHREENETKIERKWFTDNATIGVDEFGYIASAIEQCGYLEAYHQGKISCNKKGVKYFGRMVRGLLHAGLLDDSFIPIYEKLNTYRRGGEDDMCPYDIPVLLDKIQKLLAPRHNKTRRSKN